MGKSVLCHLYIPRNIPEGVVRGARFVVRIKIEADHKNSSEVAHLHKQL